MTRRRVRRSGILHRYAGVAGAIDLVLPDFRLRHWRDRLCSFVDFFAQVGLRTGRLQTKNRGLKNITKGWRMKMENRIRKLLRLAKQVKAEIKRGEHLGSDERN